MTDPSQHRPPWLDPALLAATCGWVGRIPLAPGTFGSLVGLPLSLATGSIAAGLAGAAADSSLAVPAAAIEAVVVAVLFVAAVPVCSRAADLLKCKDPGPVVIDEAVAVPVALLVIPWAERGPLALAAAFVLFRIFDILKPPPVRQCERLPAGLGIMADDVAAAVLAAGCLGVARWQGWL